MARFIELHDIDASEVNPLLINVDYIQTVEQDSYSDNAVVYTRSGAIPVEETYEQVKNLLAKEQ